MKASALHLTPAPAQPADVVEHPNLANYYNALDATYEILKLEIDPQKRLKVEEARVFFEGVIETFEEPDTTAQAPAPPPPPPPMPVAPGAAAGPPGPPVGSLQGQPGPVPDATTPDQPPA